MNIVSFSGGKDSTAMLFMMMERKITIDEIIFCDTGMEFDGMYEHIDKVERDIDRKITRLKADKSFEYYLLYHKKKSAVNKDLGYGFPRMMTNRWCTSRLKTDVIDRHIKQFENVNMFVGIAFDERHRVKEEAYPLVEWGITEKQALKYCYNMGYDFGGLYNLFDRVSCWCCPMQGLKELYNLYSYFPEKFAKLKEWESKAYNNFRPDYTLDELEARFKNRDWWKNNQVKFDLGAIV